MSASNVTLADLDTLLNVEDAMKLLRVTQRSVYAMIADGRLPQPIRLGRLLYWKPDDFQEAVRAMPHGYRRKKKAPVEVLPAHSPGAS